MGRHSKKADKYFVYEIVNTMGTIEYVGETYDIEQRYLNHISKSGKFFGRHDINIYKVAEFNTKREAYMYQCKLQTEYGWESDLEKLQVKLICPHCNFSSIGYGIYRNHFDKCKAKINPI
jgi:predicted GIY-YIG superfamily endonuclease